MATGLRPETALLIVSNASFLAALAVLALYVRSRAADRLAHPPAHSQRPLPPGDEAKTDLRKPPPAEIADWAVLAASLFPTGCFFRLTYSESTFLLAALLAMYSMTRRWPLWASALIVGLATATRPVGVAMLAPLAIHIFRRFALRGAALRLALYLPLACWGLAAFMAYQYRAFGDPIATVRTQQHWGVRRPIPWAEKAVALATLEPLRSVYDSQSSAYWASFDPHGVSWFSMQFANPLYFLAAIGLTALGAWRRWLSLEEISFSTLLLLIPYITRGYEMGMGSMGRFVAAGFPIYLVLAQLLVRLPAPLRAALLALSGFYLASYTALYGARYTIF
ncbi:MAG TPA: hypothetical protein VMV10_32805 [Pirellulales bacterium]|nr:hypothetical protein [Pirellulales bacterium]